LQKRWVLALKKRDQVWDLRYSFDSAKEKGKIEGKIEVARKSLQNGLDIHTIAIITGLSVEEIEKLSIL